MIYVINHNTNKCNIVKFNILTDILAVMCITFHITHYNINNILFLIFIKNIWILYGKQYDMYLFY